jgi:tripartite ATP-independent transporter DctP family solute receptor
MSNSPESPDQALPDFPEIPRSAPLWPLVVVAFLAGLVGIFLMLPQAAPPPLPQRVPSIPAGGSASPHAIPGVIQLIHVGGADSTFGQTARLLAEQIRALSHGSLQVEVLPDGRFQGRKYGELALMRMLQEGRFALAFLSTAPMANVDPALAVLDLPFLFDSYDHADRVLDGPIGRGLLDTLKPAGLVGLGFLETGFRVLSSSVPLPDLESLEGRRIRVMQSPVQVNFIRALGAEPVPSAVDRIHEMGRQGFIDAADRSYPTYWDFKLYEVHRHLTETNHAYSCKAMVANLPWWEGLTPEVRQAIMAAAREAEMEHRLRQRREEARVKSLATREHITIHALSAAERERFRARVQPLLDTFTRTHGSDLIDRIRAQAADQDVRSMGTDQAP